MNQESSSGQQQKRLLAVITEYKRRRDAGQTVDEQAFIKAYPDLADALKQFFQQDASSINPALASTKLGKLPDAAASGRETINPAKGNADTASEFTTRMFGRYQLLRPLGEGAMGRVFLALDTHLDRQVALKMPRTSVADKAKDTGEFLARFTREAKAAAGLKHPNICSVYDAGEIDGTAYITMDFIDGIPLSELVGSDRLTAVSEIIRLIRTIADAVMHAHSKGIIHRDLKPGNILVDDQMSPFVTDFGLARRDSSSDSSRITQEGLLIGTPAYMAPEQVRGEQTKVGAISDIYSLGVIYFELLTGRLPFEGSVPEMLAKVLRDPPPIPSRLRPDLTEDVDDVVWKMLLKEPDRRYPSMQDVITAIDKLSDKLQQATSRETTTSARATTAAAQSPFEIQKSHIELMLKKGQYAGAIRDLEALAEETSPAAKSVVEWARKTLPNAKKEAKALSPSGLAAMLKTAEQMFEKCDYQGCIQLLDDVPSLKRSEAMEALLQKAQQREAAAEELMEQIRDKERRENPEGLEALVKKYLKLKPGNAYAKKLMQALQTYSKTPAGRRRYRFERGRLQPMPEISFFRQYALLAILVGVLSFLATYAYVIVYLKGGSQTIAVHVDDEWLREQGGELTLLVDGDEHTISTSPANGEPLTIVVKVGDREFSVKHGDAVVHNPRTFTIERDGKSVLQITPTDIELRNSPLIASGPIGGDESGRQEISDLDRIAKSRWIPLITPGFQLPEPDRMKLIENGVEIDSVNLDFKDIVLRDCVLRADVRGVQGLGAALHTRTSVGNEGTRTYAGWYGGAQKMGGDFFGLGKAAAGYVEFATKHTGTPRLQGEFVDMALATIGDTIILFVDGQEILRTTDSSYSEGYLTLASSGTRTQFRNCRYQTLDSVPPTRQLGQITSDLSPWIDLFDGQDTSKWQTLGQFQVENGLLVARNCKTMAVSKDEFSDFELEVEWRLSGTTPNGGIYYRELATTQGEGNVFQIIAPTDRLVSMPLYETGALYGVLPTKGGIEKPIDEWNFTKIVCRGPVVEHWLNNELLFTYDTTSAEWRKVLSESSLPRGKDRIGTARKGHILLDAEARTGDLAYRKVRIRELTLPTGITSSSPANLTDLEKIATGQWKPLVTNKTVLPEPEKMSWKNGVLTLNKSVLPFPTINARNIVIKAEIRRVDNKSGDIHLRTTKATNDADVIGGWNFYAAWCWHYEKDGVHLLEIQKTGNPWQSVKGQTVELPVKKGEFVSMAFAAIDDRLMLFVDGKKLVDSPDSSFSSGSVALSSWVGRAEFRDMEYQILDALPASDLDKVATGTWKPLVTDQTVLSDPMKVSWKNGILTLDRIHLPFPEVRGRNIAVRAEIRKKNSRGGGLGLRGTRSEENEPDERGWKMYSAWYSDADAKKTNSFGLHRLGTPWKQLTAKPSERTYLSEEWVPMAFAAIEDQLIVFVDGKKLIEVEDTAFQEGFVILDSWFGLAEYRNLDYQILDAVPETSRPSSTVDAQPGVSPFDSDYASRLQHAWSEHLKVPVEWTNSVGMKFRLIPPGSFTIGSTQNQIDAARPNLHIGQDPNRPDRLPSELPQQQITLTRPFYLGVTEVTQQQYTTVVGTNPSTYGASGKEKDRVKDQDRSNAPVEMVSWMDTGEFCNRLSLHEGLESAYRISPDLITQTGVGGYRLPTEAEWEFACRAGTTTLFWSGDDEVSLANVAWFSANNESNMPKLVAQKPANPFGLHDMHGNVWEWTHDVWRSDTYQGLTGPASVDPRIDTGPENRRVMRGGDHFMLPAELRSACRDGYANDTFWTDVGFRVALSIEAVRFRLTQ